MKRSPTVAAGLIICTLLGVLDIAGIAALVTGDILTRTPHAMADTAAVTCPALAGSPAT
jgi:hypothetical protein